MNLIVFTGTNQSDQMTREHGDRHTPNTPMTKKALVKAHITLEYVL
jgi:hypothetical protein